MGNCCKKLFSENYNYDILDAEVNYTPPSAPLAPVILPVLPSSNASTMYESAHSDLSASFKESLVKADRILES